MREVSLKELLFSETATRLGIDNTPTDQVLINLQTLIYEVITPIINQFGDIKITSGYRSPELSKVIGSNERSQHCLGMAVDCEVLGVPNKELADWVVNHLEFDQCILEFWKACLAQDCLCWLEWRCFDYHETVSTTAYTQ